MASGPVISLAHMRCGDCPIRHRAVCSTCGPQDLADLDRIKTYRTYAAGEVLAWAGDRLTTLGSIVRGAATLSRTLPDGRRQMVGLLLPANFLGRPGRATVEFDVVAVTETMVCTFRREEFERMIERSPALGRRLLEMTLDELDAAREWMLLLGRKTARERVASLFLMLAQREAALRTTAKASDDIVFPLYLTREAVADYLGLTVETVSRQITALRRDDLIRLEENRMVHVPDLERLAAETGDDGGGGPGLRDCG